MNTYTASTPASSSNENAMVSSRNEAVYVYLNLATSSLAGEGWWADSPVTVPINTTNPAKSAKPTTTDSSLSDTLSEWCTDCIPGLGWVETIFNLKSSIINSSDKALRQVAGGGASEPSNSMQVQYDQDIIRVHYTGNQLEFLTCSRMNEGGVKRWLSLTG